VKLALCRCLEKHSPPNRGKHDYIGYVKPLGFPKSAVLCGRCGAQGVVWLDDDEVNLYRKGQRIFSGPNAFTKIKVDDNGVIIPNNQQGDKDANT
jgi:hypothetical protein